MPGIGARTGILVFVLCSLYLQAAQARPCELPGTKDVCGDNQICLGVEIGEPMCACDLGYQNADRADPPVCTEMPPNIPGATLCTETHDGRRSSHACHELSTVDSGMQPTTVIGPAPGVFPQSVEFELEVTHPSGITISAVHVRTGSDLQPTNLKIYLKLGGFNAPSPWVEVPGGDIFGGSEWDSARKAWKIFLSSPVHLPNTGGDPVAMALVSERDWQHRYTNPASTTTELTADVEAEGLVFILSGSRVRARPNFVTDSATSSFTPRFWNGVLSYCLNPQPTCRQETNNKYMERDAAGTCVCKFGEESPGVCRPGIHVRIRAENL